MIIYFLQNNCLWWLRTSFIHFISLHYLPHSTCCIEAIAHLQNYYHETMSKIANIDCLQLKLLVWQLPVCQTFSCTYVYVANMVLCIVRTNLMDLFYLVHVLGYYDTNSFFRCSKLILKPWNCEAGSFITGSYVLSFSCASVLKHICVWHC